MDNLDDHLIDSVIKAGGGCTAEEYKAVLKHLRLIQPCKLLVFSVGHDSTMWELLNDDNVTFLEDSKDWINKIYEEYDIQAAQVIYNTKQAYTAQYIKDQSLMDLKPFDFLKKDKFGAVFVDGPIGYGNGPGRTIPIKVASELKNIKQIYVHDYHRVAEQLAVDAFMLKTGRFKLKEVVGHMGIFYCV